MVAEARQQIRWKHNLPRPVELIIEILIFVLVFFITGLVFQGAIMTIGMIPLFFSSGDFLDIAREAAAGGQGTVDLTTTVTDISDTLMRSPAFVIVSLFSTLGSIIGVFIYCRALEGRKLATLGFRRGHAVREYLVGMLIGGALFSLAVLICVVTGTMTYEGFALSSIGMLILFFLGFLVQGMSEEVMCRGYFMVSLARKQSLVVAVIVSSTFFGLLHLANDGVQPLAVVNIILFGCFAAVYLLKRGNIWGAAAIHSVWNFVQGNVFGIQVSGMEKMESVFHFEATQAGELINGGAFGLEGGLATTVVLTAALVVALLLKSKDPAPRAIPSDNGSARVLVMPGAQPFPTPVTPPPPPPPTTAWPPPPPPPTTAWPPPPPPSSTQP
jgi:membrane protease YdiL (CAAX protease family)